MNRRLTLIAIGAGLALVLGSCSTEIPKPIRPDTSAAALATQATADRERALADLHREFPDAIVPEVETIRFVALTEWPEANASCLREEGYYAEAGIDGVATSAPPGQEEPFAIANYVCALKYPIDPRSNIPLNDDQIRYIYDYVTQIMTPCVHAEGYDVPPAPSRESFIATYNTDSPWNYYELVGQATSSQEEWEFINRKCPQAPSDLNG
jgi:hypothetical protein